MFHGIPTSNMACLLLCTLMLSFAAMQNAWFYTIPVLKGTVLLNWFYSAMGASIGRDVVIATDECMSGFDLVTLKDGAYLAPRSAISALSFQAAKESDSQHHLGTMICEPVTVGQRSVVGAGADIAGVVQDGQLVEPCTSSQNPAQPNSYPFNPSCSEALRGADRPLSAGESLLVLALGSMYSSFTIYMPAMGEYIVQQPVATLPVPLCNLGVATSIAADQSWPQVPQPYPWNGLLASCLDANLAVNLVAKMLTLAQMWCFPIINALNTVSNSCEQPCRRWAFIAAHSA